MIVVQQRQGLMSNLMGHGHTTGTFGPSRLARRVALTVHSLFVHPSRVDVTVAKTLLIVWWIRRRFACMVVNSALDGVKCSVKFVNYLTGVRGSSEVACACEGVSSSRFSSSRFATGTGFSSRSSPALLTRDTSDIVLRSSSVSPSSWSCSSELGETTDVP